MEEGWGEGGCRTADQSTLVNTKDILPELLKLPAPQRARLASELIHSLSSGAPLMAQGAVLVD
jgi:hypothetical protein